MDINNPKPGRAADVQVWFSGIPVQTPLKAIEARIWIAAISTILERAKKVADEMKEATEKKATKKKVAKKK